MTEFVWAQPMVPHLMEARSDRVLPVRRLFFVGQNYAAHAREMGSSVDKQAARPFYFTKSPSSLVVSDASGEACIAYPSETANYHHEVELVVVIGGAGFEVPAESAAQLIYGYAVGLDMTRRDLQAAAKAAGKPWDTAKDVEQGAVMSPVAAMSGQVLLSGRITLAVNGETRQESCLSNMVWNVSELIADLSRYYHLQPGDLVFTGTPEGVGPVQVGDVLTAEIESVGALRVGVV